MSPYNRERALEMFIIQQEEEEEKKKAISVPLI